MKRHNFKLLLILIFALTTAGIMAACGGSGTTNVADIGGSGTGITSSGTISGFGSVYVNGVKFSTSSTTKISDDDTSIGEDKLKIGQVVEIKGTSQNSATASAESIAVLKELKGPVDVAYVVTVTTTATTKTLGVMGQKVFVDDNTIIDNNIGANGLADLKVGDLVEVNGFRETAGIRATRIERQTAATGQFKASGIINATPAPSATSFTIGDLTVSYAGVTVKNLPAGGLVAGLQVQVKSAASPVNKTINATSVEVKSGLSGKSGDKGEVEGLISNFDGNCKFSVNSQAVDVCGSVTYERGVKADLANGKRIEAEGSLTNGVLIATKVAFKTSGTSGGGGGGGDTSTFVRVNAPVQTAPSQTARTITVLGKTFVVSASTQFEDKVSDARPFNIDNFASVIKAGDVAEIRGFADANGQLNATLVERNDDREIIIQGKLDGNNATQLIIQGVTVLVSTNTQFKNTSDAVISRQQFDAAVTLGAKVKAKGSNLGPSDNTVNATSGEVQIET